MSNLTTNPPLMRDYAAKFETHADEVRGAVTKLVQSSESIAGSSWSGLAQQAGHQTATEIHDAGRKIETRLNEIADGLKGSAARYEEQERESQRILSSAGA